MLSPFFCAQVRIWVYSVLATDTDALRGLRDPYLDQCWSPSPDQEVNGLHQYFDSPNRGLLSLSAAFWARSRGPLQRVDEFLLRIIKLSTSHRPSYE